MEHLPDNDDDDGEGDGDTEGEEELVDQESGPGQGLDYERYQYSSPLHGYFYRIILDEAHKIRNPYTKTSEAIRRLEPDKKHLITATPMLNKGSDFYSYLTMFWKDEWDVDLAEESISNPQFDPFDPAHEPNHTPIYQPGGALNYHEKRLALWRLNPDRFAKSMGARDNLKKCLNAYQVLRQVIPLVMLRRTQATTIEVNGVPTRIGDSIPPYRICTVELGWSNAAEFEAYRRIFDRVIQYLYTGSAGSGDGQSGFTVPTGSKKGKKVSQGNTGTRAFAIHRALGVLTFNPGLYTMLRRTYGRNLVNDVEEWYTLCADRGMSLYFEMTKPEKNLPLYADRWSFARYLAKDSPKLKYIAKLMGEICLNEADPRRVLCFTDWPMNQWDLEGFLSVRMETAVHLSALPNRPSLSPFPFFLPQTAVPLSVLPATDSYCL
jgi:SNF2-related domain